MVWLLRKGLKRPVFLVGVACTSVLVGVAVFDRLLYHPDPKGAAILLARQCSSCSNASTYPSYSRLREFEATRHFKDSVVKRLDVVYLGSNSPIEDRFAVGVSENLGAAFFSMIDGHKGTLCAQYLQENMLKYVSSHLHAGMNSEDDLRVILDMGIVDQIVAKRKLDGRSEVPVISGGAKVGGNMAPEKVEDSVRESLVNLDDKISRLGLEDAKLILSGHSLTPDMKTRVMTAIEGACALTTMVRQKDVFVANTGDCRVVLGRSQGHGKWSAIPLSEDQNAENPSEVKRLHAAHPGEVDLVLHGRVLGNLMPFRTFGDVDYKWEKEYLERIVVIPFNYKTPPYVTAEPVMSRHKLEEGDKFLILATDGFWERVSNEQAVNMVAHHLAHTKPSEKTLLRKRSNNPEPVCCQEVNVATELLWMALGGSNDAVSALLNIEPRTSRMYRDDITVMVVYL
jgi:pyruvate dehydrogenase phosphatase